MPIDHEKVIRNLQPLPSQSQTGKISELALSTSNLARSGIQAFQQVKKKAPKLGIVVAEVIDSTLLDPFGSGHPGLDEGRNKELVSSPREHPQLKMKQNTQKRGEKSGAFEKRAKNADAVVSAEEPAASPKVDNDRHMWESSDSSDGEANKSTGLSCFKTVSRSKYNAISDITPGVGHYHPRFTVVERRGPVIKLRKKEKRKRKGMASPPGSPKRAETATPTVGMSKRTVAFADSAPAASPSGGPSPSPSAQGANTSLEGATKRGTAAFVSNTPNRPPVQPAPETDYWPFNEGALSTNPRTKGSVEFRTMLLREHVRHRMTIQPEGGPDVLYHPKSHTFDVNLHIDFNKQTARPEEGRKANYPAIHMIYKTDFRPKHIPTPDFRQYASRDQTMNAIVARHQFVDPVVEYEFKETERTGGRRSASPIPFSKQAARPEFLKQVPHDLDYDTKFDSVHRRSPAFDFRNGGNHHDLSYANETTRLCNYSPDDTVLRPHVPSVGDLSRVTSREMTVANKLAQRGTLDKFYDVDTPLTKPKVKGNAQMRRQEERHGHDDGQSAHNTSASPDKFYTYNVESVLPKTAGTMSVDFSKILPRTKRAPTRM